MNKYIEAIKYGVNTAKGLFILAESSLDLLRALPQSDTSDADRKLALQDIQKMTKMGHEACSNALKQLRTMRRDLVLETPSVSRCLDRIYSDYSLSPLVCYDCQRRHGNSYH